jgi:hypothetical protein
VFFVRTAVQAPAVLRAKIGLISCLRGAWPCRPMGMHVGLCLSSRIRPSAQAAEP